LRSSILKAFFLPYFHLEMSYQKCGDNDASVATFVAIFFLMLDNAALKPNAAHKQDYDIVLKSKQGLCDTLSPPKMSLIILMVPRPYFLID